MVYGTPIESHRARWRGSVRRETDLSTKRHVTFPGRRPAADFGEKMVAGELQTEILRMNPLRIALRRNRRHHLKPGTTGHRRPRNGEAGVELIEFALVFPLLLMVVLGIVDFGFLFQRWEALTNATREGARVAVMPGYATVDVEDRITNYLAAGGVPTAAGNPAVSVTQTTIAQGAATWPATTVALSYDHEYIFVNGIVGWFGGSLGTTTLQTSATMRNEITGP